MVRISGIELPENKKAKIALTYIYGIGNYLALEILKKTNVDPEKKADKLTDDEVNKLQKEISTISTEGVLKKIVMENIKRLKQINTYRGERHTAGLPARGQQTRSNARTKRGKRATVGAMKKDLLAKRESVQKTREKKESEKK
jgi:small subunit ribosomal protein S13